jgi:predicted membrane channel-forming protein YqfA (hemolysin III family)
MLNLTAIPRISRTAVYVAQGLIAIVPLASLNLTTFELMALLVTSTAYIVGSIIYAFETDALPWFIFRADIASKHWTYVETWHLLVTVAAISSFIANLSIIKRLP